MFDINSRLLITQTKLLDDDGVCLGPWAPRFRVASYELSDEEWTAEIQASFTEVSSEQNVKQRLFVTDNLCQAQLVPHPLHKHPEGKYYNFPKS